MDSDQKNLWQGKNFQFLQHDDQTFNNDYSPHYQHHQHVSDHAREKQASLNNSHALSHEEKTSFEQKDHQTKSYSYEVYFKCSNGTYISDLLLQQGDYVLVEADRGYDVGVVNSPLPSPFDSLILSSSSKILSKLDSKVRGALAFASPENPSSSNISFVASNSASTTASLYNDPNQTLEEMFLSKISLENKALIFARAVCSELNVSHLLNVIATEFQFDRKKVTVYYQKLDPDASLCKLIRRLFGAFKMRIWMENISIDTETDLKDMLSLFQPNVKRFLELTSLPITQKDVYMFVPGLKEHWSQYENNKDMPRDDHTELLFLPTCSDAGGASSSSSSHGTSPSSENDNQAKVYSSPQESVSPLFSHSSSYSNKGHPPPHRISPPQHRDLTTTAHSHLHSHYVNHDNSNSKSGGKSNSRLTVASLLSVPYEPQFFSIGTATTTPQHHKAVRPPPPFIHPDYLQYQPPHLLARGHLPPPPPGPLVAHRHQFTGGPSPIKLAHLPPDSFNRIANSSPSTSSFSSTTTPIHQPRAHYLRPHVDSLSQPSYHSSAGHLDPNKNSNNHRNSHYLQPSPLSITAPSYNEDRNYVSTPQRYFYHQPSAAATVTPAPSNTKQLSPPQSHSSPYPQLQHHHRYQSQHPPHVPSSYGGGSGNWNHLHEQYTSRTV
jgi:hypothetical protein